MGKVPFNDPTVEELLQITEEGLRKYLDPAVETVLTVGNYIVGGGGKRLRPLLLLLFAKGLGVPQTILLEKTLPLAVGIEYIHTASLLHDDVVDEAETRRGKEAAHRIFGNGVAVLTGDYMYANALYLYALYGNQKMIEVVSQAVKLMAEGQVLELKKVGELIDEGTYFQIIDGKTSALFAASTAVGALAAQQENWQIYWDFGLKLGRAFQLIDDALDYEGDEKQVGKPIGQDLKEGKTTYPLLSVLENLNLEEVKKVLSSPNGDGYKKIVLLVKELGGVEKTKERARGELQAAREILNKVPLNGEVKRMLNQILDFVVERTY